MSDNPSASCTARAKGRRLSATPLQAGNGRHRVCARSDRDRNKGQTRQAGNRGQCDDTRSHADIPPARPLSLSLSLPALRTFSQEPSGRGTGGHPLRAATSPAARPHRPRSLCRRSSCRCLAALISVGLSHVVAAASRPGLPRCQAGGHAQCPSVAKFFRFEKKKDLVLTFGFKLTGIIADIGQFPLGTPFVQETNNVVGRVQVAGRVFPRSWVERQAGAEHVARRTTALAGRIVAQQRAVKVEPWKAGGPRQQARGRPHLHGTGQER